MEIQTGRIAILGTDQVSDGLLVHFSDGTSVLYHPQFLYDVQNRYGNTPILNEPEEDEADSYCLTGHHEYREGGQQQ